MPEPEDEGIHVCGPSVEVLDWAGGIAPAPLLPGEDEAEYALLTARIRAAARPDDFIEQLLVRDVIDLSWEIFRLRRLKSGVLRIASNDGVSSILKQIDPPVARNNGERRKLTENSRTCRSCSLDDRTAKLSLSCMLWD